MSIAPLGDTCDLFGKRSVDTEMEVRRDKAITDADLVHRYTAC